jgi:hypothetical protein
VLLVKRGDIGAEQELLRTAFARVPQNAFSMLFTPFLAEIAEHFSHSLDWARRQGALSWELRTSTSLARRELRHGGNPIATWRASNVTVRNDPEPTQTDGSEQMNALYADWVRQSRSCMSKTAWRHVVARMPDFPVFSGGSLGACNADIKLCQAAASPGISG